MRYSIIWPILSSYQIQWHMQRIPNSYRPLPRMASGECYDRQYTKYNNSATIQVVSESWVIICSIHHSTGPHLKYWAQSSWMDPETNKGLYLVSASRYESADNGNLRNGIFWGKFVYLSGDCGLGRESSMSSLLHELIQPSMRSLFYGSKLFWMVKSYEHQQLVW